MIVTKATRIVRSTRGRTSWTAPDASQHDDHMKVATADETDMSLWMTGMHYHKYPDGELISLQALSKDPRSYASITSITT